MTLFWTLFLTLFFTLSKIKSGNAEEAMEWILEHSEDADFNEPITQRQLRGLGLGRRGGRRNTEFVPHPVALQRLTEMGFEEAQVTEALRVTNNDFESAASYLLGDGVGRGGGRRRMSELEEEANAFSLNNPIIRILLQNPAVQSAMTNPRVLEAFQRIMEDPSSAGRYLSDPQIGPILMQVNNLLTQNPVLPPQGEANMEDEVEGEGEGEGEEGEEEEDLEEN